MYKLNHFSILHNKNTPIEITIGWFGGGSTSYPYTKDLEQGLQAISVGFKYETYVSDSHDYWREIYTNTSCHICGINMLHPSYYQMKPICDDCYNKGL